MFEGNQRKQIQLNKSTGTWSVNGDRVFGKVTWRDEEGIVVDIDGHTLKVSELAQILTTYEGWSFELRFIDPSDVKKRKPRAR